MRVTAINTNGLVTADLLCAIAPENGGREVRDPATGGVVGICPEHTTADLDAAISAARTAQRRWAAESAGERQATLLRAADAVEAAGEALAELLSREQGKPLNGRNARYEVAACVRWLRSTAALTLDADIVVDDELVHAELRYRPLGVIGAIGPWNWPMMITVWQVAPALLMGNSVVVKPSEYTPLSVLALIAVINSELPEGLLAVIAGGRAVGEALAVHPGIDKIAFTGSTETGKAIIRSSASTVKRLTLELGGNDAAIVLPDARVPEIADALFWGAFVNAGQTCAAIKRLYVHESIYDEVCQALIEVAGTVPMGIGLDEASLLGPLQNRAQYDIVSGLVEAARDSGATVLVGGDPLADQPGFFYPITLVADIDNDNPLVTREQFGPVLPIVRYSTIDEAVAMANGLDVGLGASVWSSDVAHAREIAGRMEAGTVWINRHASNDPRIPFGGAKQSGYGLESGVEGLKAFTQPQVLNTPRVGRLADVSAQ